MSIEKIFDGERHVSLCDGMDVAELDKYDIEDIHYNISFVQIE